MSVFQPKQAVARGFALFSLLVALGISAARFALFSLLVALGISAAALQPGEGPAATKRLLAHIAQEEDAVPLPDSVATPIRKARRALRAAVTQVEARRYARARRSLKALRVNLRQAHRAGMAQIGLPSSDPEEDTPPGPVSVLAVLSLEHRVNVRLVPVFDGLRRDTVVTSLRYTLWLVYDRRNEMLDTVIGLDPEGDGADYADGMADTVPSYVTEVNRVKTALAQNQLTDSALLGLNRALDRIQATQAKVNQAFGGGE
jgi:hypothetical protein